SSSTSSSTTPNPTPITGLSVISKPSNTLLPSVSILRPLCGLDSNLEENLESSFLLNWPNDRFELILCSEEQDPVTDLILDLVNRLIKKYPHVNARFIKTSERVGVNPKINNLIKAYRTAQSDLIWILDSNILIHPNTLARSIELLDPPCPTQRRHRIGLVHHLPVGVIGSCQRLCLGSLVESCFLNTNHARQYLAINAIGVASCLVGKSNLFYRSDLQRACQPFFRRQEQQQQSYSNDIRRARNDHESHEHLISSSVSYDDDDDGNGDDRGVEELASMRGQKLDALKWFGQFVGEDNMIGQALWDDGIRHSISIDVVGNVIGEMSLKDYVSRRIRWIRARKYMSFYSTLVEPLTESIVLGLITMISLCRLDLISIKNMKYFMIVHEFVYFLMDYSVYRSIMKSQFFSDSLDSSSGYDIYNGSSDEQLSVNTHLHQHEYSYSSPISTSPTVTTSTQSVTSSPLVTSNNISNSNLEEDNDESMIMMDKKLRRNSWMKVDFKRFLVSWIMREGLALFVWLKAIMSNQVNWRKTHERLRVLRDGRSVVVEE
ncbi:glucosylceramide synthase, partial [Phakopsora pachyrhizi]